MRVRKLLLGLAIAGFATSSLAMDDCEVTAPAVATPGIDGATCDSLALYYGIGRPRDVVAARLCAHAERGPAGGPGLDGPGVLMMIHGNGEGTARDIELAKAFACEASWAEAERDGRIEQLDAMAGDAKAAGGIDICDHVTSGMMGGFCADLHSRMESAGRAARYAVATRGFTPAQRKAFAAMREAATAFFGASSTGEQDMSGTGRNAFAIDWRDKLEDELLADLERYEQGRLPHGGSKAAREADAALNAAYRDRIDTLEKKAAGKDEEAFPGTEDVAGTRDAQRAWLAYRDAFLAFARLRYPQVAPDAWVDVLSRARTRMFVRMQYGWDD
jgi:uncharacterized protein YecT (DUF1311 family)